MKIGFDHNSTEANHALRDHIERVVLKHLEAWFASDRNTGSEAIASNIARDVTTDLSVEVTLSIGLLD